MNNKELGALGEEAARKYLEAKGYHHLASNWRNRLGEIDLIMLSADGVLVFIEVKTRTSLSKGSGFEAVDQRKLEQLYRMVDSFLIKYRKYQNKAIRLDVISVSYDKKTKEVTDIKQLQVN